MNRKQFLVCFAGFLVFSLVVAACGGGGGGSGGGGNVDTAGGVGKVSDNTWVGKVEGSDAYAVIMITDLRHLVFITDGKALGLWFSGDVGVAGAGYFQFQDEQLRAINGHPSGKNFVGTVTTAPGQHLPFTLVPAKGDAGLYRSKDGAWIVLEDGSFRGAKVDGDGKVEGLATRGGTKWTDAAAEP